MPNGPDDDPLPNRAEVARVGLYRDFLNCAALPDDQLIQRALEKLETAPLSADRRRLPLVCIAILLDQLPDGPQRNAFLRRYTALRRSP